MKRKRRKTSGNILKVSKGNISSILLIAILFIGIVGTGLYLGNNVNNSSSGTPPSNNLPATQSPANDPEKRPRLQLKTFSLTPASLTPAESEGNNVPPGIYPAYPSPVIPTMIISSSGCTYTIGFWKNHAGFGPQDDAVSPLLPIWLGTANGAKSVNVSDTKKAVEILMKSDDSSNGINKLYAQALAAKLNMKSGSQDNNLYITEVDNFLADYDSGAWLSLTSGQQTQVLNWARVFDEFNNGRFGLPHCP